MQTVNKAYPIFLLLSALLLVDLSWAQQESQYTQYLFNTMSINPAYAGARGRLSTLAMYRNQWVGMTGAPQTLNISGHTPLGESARVGVGVEFISDKIGPAATHTVAGNFSYVISFNHNLHWSFGIKGGVMNLNLDEDKLNIYDYNNLDLDLSNRIMPVVGLGTYLYGNRWYVGLSSPNFLETKHYDDVQVSTAKEKMHYYLIAGYFLPLSEEIALKPTTLIRAIQGAPLAMDISLNAMFFNKFSLGASYRLNADISAMATFNIKEQFLIGYAYDFSTTELARYNSGSHEIILRFELAERKADPYHRMTPIF